MAIFKRLRRFLGIEKNRLKKRIPSMYVSELDLSKGFMVISDVKTNEIINIDLYNQKGFSTINHDYEKKRLNRLSKSCSDINNKIIYNDKYRVEMRKVCY